MPEQILAPRVLNGDQEPNQVKDFEGVNITNARFTQDQRLTAIDGFKEIPNPFLEAGSNTCIGAVPEESGRFVVSFIHNSLGKHRIVAFFKETATFFCVLKNETVANGLGFDTANPITARILDEMLFWNDGVNPPGSAHIGALMRIYDSTAPIESDFVYSMGGSDILNESLTVSRVAPTAVPTFTKVATSDPIRLIGNQSCQFALDYVYYGGTVSSLGPHSAATKLNTERENELGFNTIRISLSTLTGAVFACLLYEVRKVRLWCKRDEITFLIKEWDREDAADADFFLGSTASIFDYKGTVTGEVMDRVSALRPYSDTPITAKCLEIAQNRLWLGGNLRGYDTPTKTSLTVALGPSVAVNATTVSVTIYAFFHAGSNGTDDYAYGAYVLIDPPGKPGVYLVSGTDITSMGTHTYPTLPAPPTTVSQSALVQIGAYVWTAVYSTTPAGYGYDAYTHYPVGPISLTSFTSKALLKTGTTYKYGVVFYDAYQRKCGVVTKDAFSVATPDRDYDFTTGYDRINWTLSNTAAADEIPATAKYYAVVATLNQRTRSFVQAIATVVAYVKKDSSSNYMYD
ncbi:MAG: hypothetical protein EOP50_06245, partial [Sphingobacteriales bacterium]